MVIATTTARSGVSQLSDSSAYTTGGSNGKTLQLTTLSATGTSAQFTAPRIPSEHIGVDVDVLENCTAALSSLCAMCDDNAKRVGDSGGIDLMVGLTTSTCCHWQCCY